MSIDYSFSQLVGRKVLIVGDVGTGKTALMASLLEEAIGLHYGPEITVVDMAPPSMTARGVRIGGTLAEATDTIRYVRYLRPREVKAPRVMGKSPQEVLLFADFNRQEIDRMLDAFLENPTPILFINDISLYLQMGDVKKLGRVIDVTETFIANGYFGDKLAEDMGTGISGNEKERMQELMKLMDVVITLPK
ncbi:MAG: ATP-binding protein [Candidatus Bathyarchaeia archaeon]